MILLQLSAGQGPEECARAVALAFEHLQKQARSLAVEVQLLEAIEGRFNQSFKSVLIRLNGENAKLLSQQWQGAMQWICPSPYRAGHKRKNWFFSGEAFALDAPEQPNTVSESDIEFKSCRASGAGGQHVNTTDSAVQATHKPTGISVRIESERSQHANKKLARALIAFKLSQLALQQQQEQQKQRWTQHWNLERGNPKKVFKGPTFKPVE